MDGVAVFVGFPVLSIVVGVDEGDMEPLFGIKRSIGPELLDGFGRG